MLRLLFLLMGGPVLRDAWLWLVALGCLCAAAGTGMLLDILDDGYLSFPFCLLGLFLIVEGMIELPGTLLSTGSRRWPGLAKAAGLMLVGAAVLVSPRDNGFCASLLFAIAFLFDGGFRVISCGLMRCRRWHQKMALGCGEMLFSLMIVTSWPFPHHVIVPLCFSALLLGWARCIWIMARQIHALPDNVSVAALPLFTRTGLRRPHGLDYVHPPCTSTAVSTPLNIYIWTPVGSGEVSGRRPWFDRWVAAIDHKGVVSTGHTSLAMGEEIYVSLYPQDDIDRDFAGFLQTLRAREEYDVPGRYLASLEQEIKAWCQPDCRLELVHYNQAALRNYWATYASHTRYNLTSRNCSTSVMQALDVASEGLLGIKGLKGLLVLFNPDFWLLSLVRSRAEGMTWTPGLVMDYQLLLRRVLEGQNRYRSPIGAFASWRKDLLSTRILVRKSLTPAKSRLR